MDRWTRAFARYRDRGDLDALGVVFDGLAPRLLALALHVTGNPADAEDALQAAFVVAMKKARAFDCRGEVAPWLLGILAGEARNLRRREQRRRAEPLPDELVAGGVGADEAAERRELVAELRTRIDRALPDEQRQALLLQLQHGLQPAEIAEVLGVSPGTVRMRLHRGLQRLKRALPAGLVGVALAGTASRGLAAVRTVVMREAAALGAVAATSGAVAVGGVMMKKVVVAVAAFAAVWFAWSSLTAPPSQLPPGDAATGRAERASADVPAVEPSVDAVGLAREDASGVASAAGEAASATGSLRIVVRADEARPAGVNVTEVAASAGSGVPLAGALVLAWPGDRPDGAADGRRVEARADLDGVARLPDLEVGAWRVVAAAGGRKFGSPLQAVVEPDVVRTFEIHGMLTRTVHGRVVDRRGAAVAGADVLVGSRVEPPFSPERFVRRGARSAADGSFSVPCTDAEECVGAHRVGYGASASHLVHQLGDGEVTLVLEPEAGAVAGVVVDDTGAPVPDAVVVVAPPEESLRRDVDGTLRGPRVAATTRTDRAGRFVLDGLAPDDCTCLAWRPPLGGAKQSVRVVAGERAELRLVMERRAAVHGYLRDAAGGPVPGVHVSLQIVDERSSRTAIAAHDGSYRFEGVPLRAFTLTACRISSGAQASAEFAAPTEREVRADLVLDEGPALRGRATTASGRALDGWSVVAFVDGEPRRAEVRDGGAFVLHGLAPGAQRLELRRPPLPGEDEPEEPDHVATGEPGEPVAIVVPDALWPVTTVRLRVVGADGQPVRGAWADLPDAAPPEMGEPPADGRYAFEDVLPGRHRLRFGGPGHVRASRRVDVDGQPELDLGDVRLQPAATLRVRYVRPDGRAWQGRPPIPWLMNAVGRTLRGGEIDYTNEEDVVVVSGVPPGDYSITTPFGLVHAPAAVTLVAGQESRLTLQPMVGRRCTVAIAHPEGVTALQLTVRLGDGQVVVERALTLAFEGGTERVELMLPVGRSTLELREGTHATTKELVVGGDDDAPNEFEASFSRR